MKKTIALLLFLLFVTTAAVAQIQLKIDKSTVAIDSAGGKHKMKDWEKLYKKGYGVRPENAKDPTTRWIVYKLNQNNTIEEGNSFRPFSTTDIHDNKISLADSAGKVVVLNFWFINCAPCRKEIPALNEVVEKYKADPRVVFYAIALDAKEQLQTFLQQTNFSYIIVPNGRTIAALYGVNGFPTNMVFANNKAIFVKRGYGSGTVAELKRALKKALKD